MTRNPRHFFVFFELWRIPDSDVFKGGFCGDLKTDASRKSISKR